MSEIYFFRHGQASFGTDNYDRLSPTGIRQSEVLARFLDDQGIRFDAVYTGRMNRHEETARPFCDRYGGRRHHLARPERVAAFDEYDSDALLSARSRRDPGRKGGDDCPAGPRHQKSKFQAYFAETVVRWMTGEFDADKKVEGFSSFCHRVQNGIRQIMDRHGRDKRIAVFTSGGPISVAVKTALSLSDEKTVDISWQIMNASLTCLKYSSRKKIALSIFNSATHLWLTKDSSLVTYR